MCQEEKEKTNQFYLKGNCSGKHFILNGLRLRNNQHWKRLYKKNINYMLLNKPSWLLLI